MQLLASLLLASQAFAAPAPASKLEKRIDPSAYRAFSLEGIEPIKNIQVGPRPFYLVRDLEDSDLKTQLEGCTEKKSRTTSWAIGHRGGGTLQFPEHTVESALAGARMGAGVLECDSTFTKDLELVCRHSQCDLHTTTNVVATPLGAKCTQPFKPATGNSTASAKCCTSDFTLDEFLSLCGKMDSFNASATTPEDYLGNVPAWRTTLYNQCGTLMSLKDHISLVEALGLEHTPELKLPQVPMPFNGFTQEAYAQKLVDTYKEANIPWERIWGQSFNYPDLLYWLEHEPEFAAQTILLDQTLPVEAAVQNLTTYKEAGVRIVGPAFNYLLKTENGTIVPSEYATKAKELGLDIISWSLERSPPVAEAKKEKDSYYSSIFDGLHRDGDLLVAIDVLAQKVGVKKMFADWTGTITFYANCVGLK